jgi:hypothetical protein
MRAKQINIVQVTDFFENESNRIFTLADLDAVFFKNRVGWELPKTMTPESFVTMLINRTPLRQLNLASPHYSSPVRYAWGVEPPPMSVAVSIMKQDSFFSHRSAMWIHRLDEDAKAIFVNKEQSEKAQFPSQLSQDAIDRAFRSEQRVSKMFYKYQDATITVLNGKHTGRLDVYPATSPSGHQVEVTSIERTLIDATVRPGYAGGVVGVLRAFRLARNRASIGNLIALLTKLNYKYPYHQSIGFYLKKAGYSNSEQLLAKANDMQFNFYLCHGLKEPAFDEEWKIFFPETLR